MKKGFTLSELMIAITVLGILCAAILPALLNNNPNQNKMMMKKAYYLTSEVVSELINNPSLYPIKNTSGTNFEFNEFANTEAVEIGTTSYSGVTKFPMLFAKLINTDDSPGTTCSNLCYDKSTNSSCTTFTSQDGMDWCINSLSASPTEYFITVDVNADKKPNCYQGDSSTTCSGRTKSLDRLIMKVGTDGGIRLLSGQSWAKEAISVSSDLSGD